MIPSIKVKAYHSRTINELSEHYNKSMVSHDLLDLIELTMSIYAKKQQVTEQKRKLGAVDERFMKQAEELLFGELALALDIAKGDVQNYITERVGGLDLSLTV
jgi:CarD family transcriptional regulator